MRPEEMNVNYHPEIYYKGHAHMVEYKFHELFENTFVYEMCWYYLNDFMNDSIMCFSIVSRLYFRIFMKDWIRPDVQVVIAKLISYILKIDADKDILEETLSKKIVFAEEYLVDY